MRFAIQCSLLVPVFCVILFGNASASEGPGSASVPEGVFQQAGGDVAPSVPAGAYPGALTADWANFDGQAAAVPPPANITGPTDQRYANDVCCDDPVYVLGCIRSTPGGFENFISPMTNPVFFEDPRTLSEVRFIYLNHQTPRALGADTVELIAAQFRLALTERLSIVAAKDGFIMTDSPLLDDGWADVAIGLKYNLLRDPCCRQIVSAGLSYEMPVGSTRALQGNGDGEFHLYLTGGTEFRENWHWLSATGFRLPADTSSESQVWYWSNHIDRRITSGGLYVFGEANWFHWIDGANGGVPGIEGNDLFNLGSTGVAGNDIVTGGLGVKYAPSQNMEIGFAWEVPLTDRRDLLDDRYTVDWILRF